MTDLLGYAASCAVLATFLTRTMVPLRLIAILSNVLFLAFGYVQHIYPIFFLHLALLPINAWRLVTAQLRATVQAPMSQLRAGLSDPLRPYAFWFAVGLLAGLAGSVAVLLMSSADILPPAGQ
jgi:hypothetical protein